MDFLDQKTKGFLGFKVQFDGARFIKVYKTLSAVKNLNIENS